MSLLSKVKSFVEANVPKTSDEESEKIEETQSKTLNKVKDIGGKGVDVFLKTEEGKKVKMQIVSYYAKKYWWQLSIIALFDIIGIYSATRFAISKG